MSDWLNTGGTPDALLRLAEAALDAPQDDPAAERFIAAGVQLLQAEHGRQHAVRTLRRIAIELEVDQR